MKFVDVQMQSGTYDCGLFAIAHATALAQGEQPGNYLYDQPEMRKHLYKSFQMKTKTLFPLKKRRRNKELKVKTEEEILANVVYLSFQIHGGSNAATATIGFISIHASVCPLRHYSQRTTGFVMTVRKLIVFLYNNG